jgi:hypothetical protein
MSPLQKQRWGLAALAAGAGLLALWCAWAYLVPATAVWSQQDQQVYAEAAERLHQAGHGLEDAQRSRSKAKLAAAQEEFQAAQAQADAEEERLKAAQSRGDWIPRVLLGTAAAAMLAGLALLAR